MKNEGRFQGEDDPDPGSLRDDPTRETEPTGDELPVDDGIIRVLGELPEGAFVSEDGLGQIMARSQKTIKRSIRRGELPPSVPFVGRRGWTVRAIIEHIETRLAAAAEQAERERQRLSGYRP